MTGDSLVSPPSPGVRAAHTCVLTVQTESPRHHTLHFDGAEQAAELQDVVGN